MGIKGKLVAEYAKEHSYYETLDFVCKLIGLDSASFDKEIENSPKEDKIEGENKNE